MQMHFLINQYIENVFGHTIWRIHFEQAWHEGIYCVNYVSNRWHIQSEQLI